MEEVFRFVGESMTVILDWGKSSLKSWNGIDKAVRNNEFRNDTITLWDRFEI